MIAASVLLFALSLSLQSACEKDQPDPILGFWKNLDNDEQYGWVFYSDNLFGRYTELCPPDEGHLGFYWAGEYERTSDGLILNDSIRWVVDFHNINSCTVETETDTFNLQRQLWGE